MNIVRNEKVVLLKPIKSLQTVGEIYEIANLTDTAIVLRDVNTKIAVGAISIDDFDKYFAKIEDVKGWTPWQRLVDGASNTIAFYRTNYKKVQVKTVGGYRSETSCNKCDNFNLYFGIYLAYARCMDKFYNDVKRDYEEGLKNVTSDMIANQNMIKKMINSLDKKEN